MRAKKLAKGDKFHPVLCFLWACGLMLAALLHVVPVRAMATEAQFVTWDALSPTTDQRRMDTPARPDPNTITVPAHEASDNSADHLFDPLSGVFSAADQWDQQSKVIVPDVLDGTVVIDGYVLPLGWDGNRVVDFLLVPWVGACIHMPSPPPNQIIHVSYPEGLVLDKQFEAVRLSGVLQHTPAEHDLFLVDGQRKIPVSYAMQGAELAGTPAKIVAMSAADLPKLAQIQIWVSSVFTQSMEAVGQGGSVKALLFALAMSFAYGALHTLGPGHGKSVVISNFVGTGGSLRRGLGMGVQIAVFHVLSAVVVVFLLDLAVRQTTGSAPSDFRAIRFSSNALIMGIGAVMVWKAVSATLARRDALAFEKASRGGAHRDGHAHHDHHHHNHHQHLHQHHHHGHTGCAACAAAADPKAGTWIAASVGVVPCSGALLVMLFGLANDLIWPAILMVMFISAGMALAMSAIGVAAIWGRSLAESHFTARSDRVLNFDMSAKLAGAMSVFAIGGLLFMLTLSYPPVLQPAISTVASQQGSTTPPEG